MNHRSNNSITRVRIISVCMHSIIIFMFSTQVSVAESAKDWINKGEKALAVAIDTQPINNKAKNVILFVGDGMGISTITAARIFEGQSKGFDGESNQLAFEKLPYVGLSKTYSANQQTPDSAPTMTAMVTGVKTNDGIISLDQSVTRDEQDSTKVLAAHLVTILELAEKNGLSTGVVTTTRVTHATPAATYAHTSNRDWECDSQLAQNSLVKDIAVQLIDNFGKNGIGNGLEVVLGGGRTYFLPNSATDPEYINMLGKRTDGRNLIEEFIQKFNATYVWNKEQFDAINPINSERLLGLFEPSHMHYEYDRPNDKAKEPSLSEMTVKAIELLQKNKKGFFLMVEGGRIDHAHHAGNAYRALGETVAFSDAVKVALSKVSLKETLVIVTADHSHTFTISGYPVRGNPILGKVIKPSNTNFAMADDRHPYTTLNYANGTGYYNADDKSINDDDLGSEIVELKKSHAGRIANMETVDTENPNFHQEVTVPLSAETHSGEDVAIYAGGPMAHLIHGAQEQSYIYYVMKYALGF